MNKSLIFNQPDRPAWAGIGGLNRPGAIRDGKSRVRNVTVELLVHVLNRLLERETPVGLKVEVTLRYLIERRPAVVGSPNVRSGLERERLGQLKLALVLQEMGKPGGLNLLAKVAAGFTIKTNPAQGVPFAMS